MRSCRTWIGRDRSGSFPASSAQSNAIEGSEMHGRRSKQAMINADREHLDPVSANLRITYDRQAEEIQFARLHLDQNLPDACDAERKIGASAQSEKCQTVRDSHPPSPASAVTRMHSACRTDGLHFGRTRSVIDQLFVCSGSGFRFEVVRNRELAFALPKTSV